jgi:peptidoglycan/xylan/chitin deacetylase (PgdA/CDA1 family)
MVTAATHIPALEVLWAITGVITVIFAVRAVAALLPRHRKVLSGAIVAVTVLAVGASVGAARWQAASAAYQLPAAPVKAVPLHNDARNGTVVFTFDDGPDAYTGQVIAELKELHIHGVFFAIGWKVAAHPGLIRAEMANGDVVGNHTWDHKSFTGKGIGVGAGGPPLTQAQVRAELSSTNAAIIAAGAPRPTLWRPPYGAVNAADDVTAQSLGLRIVLDSGANIVDSNDWAGLSAKQIAAQVDSVLRNGTIIAFHDGLPTAPQMIKALTLIVAFMNRHHLGATTIVRPDATGGIVPNLTPDHA